MSYSYPVHFVVRHPLIFAGRVLRRFHTNKGILLAGAVAYYALLSLVPLLILLLVTLSHLVDQTQLLLLLNHYLAHLLPSGSDSVMQQVAQFLDHRQSLGWLMAGALLFFSSLAFGVLETAMAIIFAHRHAVHTRHPLTSLLLPYLYMLLMGFGLVLETVFIGLLQARLVGDMQLFGWAWSPGTLQGSLIYLLGLLSQIGVLTLFYTLMPPGRLPMRHAVIGAIAATLLWEAGRSGMAWYFANLSVVNVVYGSLTGAVVALLTLEVISIIILLGAQVIAEFELLCPNTEATGTTAAF